MRLTQYLLLQKLLREEAILINASTIIFDEDYTTHFAEIVDEARDMYIERSLDERFTFITDLTDAYIEQIGERPDRDELYKLSSIYLYDYLEGDTRQNKKSIEEYPILTLVQLHRRTTGHRSVRTNLGFAYREVSLESAFSIGTDGNNHALPTRYYR